MTVLVVLAANSAVCNQMTSRVLVSQVDESIAGHVHVIGAY
jgi:hypothetical protein